MSDELGPRVQSVRDTGAASGEGNEPGTRAKTAASHSRKAELDAALADYSIGGAINALRAYPTAMSVLVDIAEGGYMAGMPEEITAEIKAALDLAKGGDGRIYR